MLTEFIEHLELEEVDGGVSVTVFYKHSYLEDPPTIEATLFLPKEEVEKAQRHSLITITSYFYEVGKILGLEVAYTNCATPTIDWVLTKDIPDDNPAAKLANTPENMLKIAQAPGRTFWRADSFRWPEDKQI